MVGDRLKQVRKEKGLTQKGLAELLGTSPGYISEIEKNKKTPGGDFFATLKRNIGVSIDWLLTGEGSPYIYKDGIGADAGGVDHGDGKNDVVILKHIDLVKRFNDRDSAVSINEKLLVLEKLSPSAFRKMDGYLSGLIDGIRMSRGDGEAGENTATSGEVAVNSKKSGAK